MEMQQQLASANNDDKIKKWRVRALRAEKTQAELLEVLKESTESAQDMANEMAELQASLATIEALSKTFNSIVDSNRSISF